MKKITFILFALITGSAFAQGDASATANAAADIVSPINISAEQDLNFGKVANNTAGSVIVNPDGTISGLAQIGSTTPTPAQFDVTAASGYSYTITLPTTVELTSGTNTIEVDTFKHDAGTTITGTGSIQTVGVGATLDVVANQPTGNYTGTFNVTVTYE